MVGMVTVSLVGAPGRLPSLTTRRCNKEELSASILKMLEATNTRWHLSVRLLKEGRAEYLQALSFSFFKALAGPLTPLQAQQNKQTNHAEHYISSRLMFMQTVESAAHTL